MRGYCRNLKLGDWTCAADESLGAYQAYGLGRLPWWQTFTVSGLLSYVKFWRQGKALPRPRADIRRAGGDFVVDPDGRLALVHPGRNPHDRPSVDAIIAALR